MPIPVVTVAQMREWEQATWASGVKETAVIRNAGLAVARLMERITRPDDYVLFLAGKGHNGDDAAWACELSTQRRCKLIRVAEPEVAAPEIDEALRRRPALLVDGLFGIGLNRPLSSAWEKLIAQLNQADCSILAVDVPSGLNADTGQPMETAVRARCTLTFGAVKRGLLTTSAAPFVGRLEVAADNGLLPCPFTSQVSLTAPEDFTNFPPPRPIAGHKGTFGHLAIFAGSPGYHGAAVLVARGAQRAQPGLITLWTQSAVLLPVAAQLQSVMVRSATDDTRLPESVTAIVIGPGLASSDLTEPFKRAMGRLWQESPLPVLADASALDWLPEGACPPNALRVITPHPGEAARMLGVASAEVQANRVRAVCELSRRWGGCHVALKGHQTVLGRDTGPVFINNSGNPYLAQGGSGDLLAGYLGGLLAQPRLQSQADLALRFGIWQHGAAADQLRNSRPNFAVEDLAERLGAVQPEAVA
jgi:NAD(P)H-hydrate epimerase